MNALKGTSPAYADELKAYLDRTGEDQQDLADGAGIPRSSLSTYLSGKRKPKPDAWLKLCAYMGVEAYAFACLLRPLGGGWSPFSVALFRSLPAGEYELRDSAGEVARVTVRISMRLPLMVLHAAEAPASKQGARSHA